MSARSPLIDLAAARAGGRALAANDEFFAPKANLLKPGRGVLVEGKYTARGKWMDGWETRRRREPGHDWCIVRLGVPGVIRAVTVDTNHFRGNHPDACSLDAAGSARGGWTEVLPRSPLQGHSENRFDIRHEARFTHVRLNIFPDGGVARLRIWGAARPDWRRIGAARIDLAAIQHGGLPVAASDEFFGEPLNLILPGRPANMGDGWETRRRRGPGHDWVIVRLGHRGTVEEIAVDTTHFKGNFPDGASVEGCDAPGLAGTASPGPGTGWRELVPRTRLRANAQHRFRVTPGEPVTHVRLSIFPDGGVARLRVYGRPA
ncbi:MAG: allantoicase [Gemmatimonadales bacterium]